MKAADLEMTFTQSLMVKAADELAMIRWLNSTDGANGTNRPKLISQILNEKEEEQRGYDSPEEFMRAYYGY